MAATEKMELVKIITTAVVAVRVGDRIVREEESSPAASYSREELAAKWDQAEEGIKAMNGANRAARRK